MLQKCLKLIKETKAELDGTYRKGLNRVFEKYELVTREEFDIQTAVLARTRAKLQILEQRLKELENNQK